MKDSEGGWKKVPLETLAEFRNGINYSKDNFGKGAKVINVKDFQDLSLAPFEDLDEINPNGVVKEDSFLNEGDIIFVRSNGNRQLIGRSLFVSKPPKNVTHSAFTIRTRFVSKQAFPRFFAYVFRSNIIRQYLSAYGSGTNISNLNQKILSNLEVPLPPFCEQQKIATTLSTYDDLIENNTRRIEILEQMAKLIYEEWFVKFRFPGHENVKMVPSDLGEIPEGWEVKKLGDICYIVMGQSPKSEFYNENGEGLPFHQGVTNFNNLFPTDKVYCTVLNRVAEKGDILFSVRAPVGRINIANKKIVIGRGLCAIRSKTASQNFIFQQLKHKFQMEDSMGGGTIFKSVTKDDMHNIKVIFPLTGLISKFEETTQPMFRSLEVLTMKNQNLRKTRDLLLPKLISGEIDVSDLDIHIRNEFQES
jgi:type I restriction enzyme S subunit